MAGRWHVTPQVVRQLTLIIKLGLGRSMDGDSQMALMWFEEAQETLKRMIAEETSRTDPEGKS